MKDRIKSVVGNLLVTFFPKKAARLESNGLTMVDLNYTFIERQMRHVILKNIETKNNLDHLSKIHNNFWVNQGIDVFSWNNSFNDNFLPNCTFIFEILKKNFFKDESQFKTLVEIGVGNGDVLHYLSLNFPEIDNFIGIDLSSEQIKINQDKYKENSKLEFVSADVLEWIKKEGRQDMIFVTSNGVFEYFTEQQLREFIEYVHGLGRVLFVTIEPNAIGHDFELNPNSIIYGIERSFSHNYNKIFQDYGFTIFHQSKKRVYGFEMSYILAGNLKY
ncbi:class I SAM-dependent methyltransferase [Flavobacterium eburneipallidum]|uniref:class I SAM-dependent methyltransferase n=1 Tax=Flavobacterium eburneipallidum TaxID=3003263 RepID=UPI00248242BD|nr:class I SAM-dependent methyltransferase [Flavobacterium eburneipallidum]